ncbi:hypothetical protein [Chitinophaga sp. LS1]|uniref:hypothetical protein n=1 Tax=Chitinophaga sp. LS1 TaxID=3051176 RepID=UPI002AAAB347|nr:hypothetical protein [Chitinophaga sp. LS1]WPV63752.1 hypothetical protein QQL36_18290 [Chitinophaga sp. LS1]
MKYSKQATENYAKSIRKKDCLELIDTLIRREGHEGSTGFNGNEVVLNMDCVEEKKANQEGRLLNKSMDSAFIAEDETGTQQEIVLVEFRFNYQSLKNLDRNSLLGKVAGSTSALGNPTNMHDEYYFVFNPDLKQQAISRFNRMNPAIPQQYKAVDISDVKDMFFDIA